MKQVDSVANINLPVLLIGETGTLKELVASAIHQHSDRHDQPFIVVNCGAIPAQLLESELFGTQIGAGYTKKPMVALSCSTRLRQPRPFSLSYYAHYKQAKSGAWDRMSHGK